MAGLYTSDPEAMNVNVVSGSAGAEFNETPPALSDGETASLQLDENGSLRIVQTDENGAIVDVIANPTVNAPLDKQHPTTSWTYTSGSTAILANTTTAVTIKAADATLRHYIDGISISHGTLGAACIIGIRDGAAGTTLWSHQLGTAALQGFSPPIPVGILKGTAATLLEVVTFTANTSGGITVNVQGHTAA